VIITITTFLALNKLIPDEEGTAKLQETIESFGIFGAIVFILIVAIEVIVAPIPGLPLYLIGGAIFGGIKGGIYALIGNIIGSAICFHIGRLIGKPYVDKIFDKKKTKNVMDLIESRGPFFIFLVRLNPITSSDLFSYASGLTKMRFSYFITATTLGLVPYAFFPSIIGNYLTQLNYLSIIGLLFLLLITFMIGLVKKDKKDKKQ